MSVHLIEAPPAARVERISPGDLTALGSDVGPVPVNVGAILFLDAGDGFDLSATEAVLVQRMRLIPRLCQRLTDGKRGSRRPVWVDVPDVDLAAHLERVRCAAPGDRTAVLAVACAAVTRPLPRSRPLWRAVFVTGLAGGQVALVVVLHHVLADGIGGLAVLSALTDGPVPRLVDEPAGPAPSRDRVLADPAVTRWHQVSGIPRAVVGLGTAAAELGARHPARAPRCSLNAPTGPRRQLATVAIELEPLRAAAHRHGATVNDALLGAVTGALQALLRHRGEQVPPDLVVSVPVSARVSTTTGDLGNQVGVMRVRVPTTDPAGARLVEIAAITRRQKTTTRGASASLVGPVFRVLTGLGVFRWFMDHQRLVNVFLTDVPGPPRRLRLNGTEITDVVPLTVTAGNVSVAFAALSYAGSLTITVIADPDQVPDLAILTTALEQELQTLARST